MTRNLQMRSLALAAGAALAATGAAVQASAFQLAEQSASGLGVAFAGMAAAGQGASTVFWNPAAMSLLPGVQGAAVLSYISPRTQFKEDGEFSVDLVLSKKDGEALVKQLTPLGHFGP